MPDEPLCLLSVHAHPDDEASKGAGTVAKYAALGVRTVLVCCTGGEAGEILNPAMDTDEVRADLHAVRMRELERSTSVIGYTDVELLGYRDSGMPESESNKHPDSFAQAPLDEAVRKLVALIRAHRPQVIVTYDDEQSRYPHPDHLRVHEISVIAFDAAGDPDRYPGLGEPWQPLKLYYSAWSVKRMLAMHERMVELGMEPPFDEERLESFRKAAADDTRTTTSVDIYEHANVRQEALIAHRTQVDPTSRFWFGLPDEENRKIHPFDDYVLARSLVDTSLPEDDLFAGVRSRVNR
jgi:mycothiol S-conjugate amidase